MTKHLEYICGQRRDMFPETVSYSRFVELEKTVGLPLAVFIKKFLLGRYTGISFVDSTTRKACRSQRVS